MKGSLKLITTLVILGNVTFFNAQAQKLGNATYINGSTLNTITTAVPFLMIAPDARSGALGDAGVALSPDANAIHWNPAKLAFIDKELGFSVSHTPWLSALVNDISLSYMSGYKQLDKRQAIGLSLLYFSLGDIERTDESGGSLGAYNPNEFSTDLSYARKLSDKLSLGMSLRFIYSNLTGGLFVGGSETKAGTSIAADISTYYQTDFEVKGKNSIFAFGANLSNIGSKMTYTETAEKDFIPMNLRLGTAWTIELDKYNSVAIAFDINKLLVPTPPIYNDTTDAVEFGKDPNRGVVSSIFDSWADAPGGFSEEMREFTYSTGLEYWYDKQFALRGGYFYEHASKGNRKYFALGAGLKYNVFGVDFAYLIPTQQRHPLENTLRFTLHFDFNAFQGKTSPIQNVEEADEG